MELFRSLSTYRILRRIFKNMKSLVWIIFLLGALKAVAQESPVFDEGIIMTKRGDSLKCFVRVDIEYGSKIFYKKEKDGTESSIRAKEVKFISTHREYLENIQVGKKELLMMLVAKGKALLFLNIATGAPRRQMLLGLPTQNKPAEVAVYVVKKGSVYTEVKREHYRDILSGLMFDCPTISQKMRSKQTAYPYEDIEMVVAAYNSCR